MQQALKQCFQLLKDNIKIPERSASCEDDDEEDEGEAADMEGISLNWVGHDLFQAFKVHSKKTLFFLFMECMLKNSAGFLPSLCVLIDACLL